MSNDFSALNDESWASGGADSMADSIEEEDEYLENYNPRLIPTLKYFVPISDVVKILEAYENIRLSGEVYDMQELYGIRSANTNYLTEKHRKHIDFNPFFNGLDNNNKKRYALMLLKKLDKQQFVEVEDI